MANKLSLKVSKEIKEINKYKIELSQKSPEELYNIITSLIIKNVNSKSDILKLKAYKSLLEVKKDELMPSFKSGMKYKPYPDIFDPDLILNYL